MSIKDIKILIDFYIAVLSPFTNTVSIFIYNYEIKWNIISTNPMNTNWARFHNIPIRIELNANK